MSVLLLNGNALHIPLADRSVHCIVTSPPYYGLRDYGTATWEGGSKDCDHIKLATGGNEKQGPNKGNNNFEAQPYKNICGKCGARRVDNQIGLEESPEAYIARMVEVFRECWRVLRDDGTLWLNIGDSYAGSGGAGGWNIDRAGQQDNANRKVQGLKPKDLIGVPWLLAFALRADGWYLRQDIIWHKPNPMPESCTDRCTKAHEYLFLLSKSARYYYDADAIREGGTGRNWRDGHGNIMGAGEHKKHDGYVDNGEGREIGYEIGRNRRSVWTISTSPYAGAHFATFPPALVEPCIKAGTSERGACPKCGAPWERVTDIEYLSAIQTKKSTPKSRAEQGIRASVIRMGDGKKVETLGWQPICECNAGAPIACTVFDPFAGSGTTLQVARALGRHGVGVDLSLKYLQECARPRLDLDALDAWTYGIATKGSTIADLPLFADLEG